MKLLHHIAQIFLKILIFRTKARTPVLKEAVETEELFYDITFSSNYRRLDQTLKSNLLSRLQKLKSLAIFY